MQEGNETRNRKDGRYQSIILKGENKQGKQTISRQIQSRYHKSEDEEIAEKLKARDASYFLLEEIFPITEKEKEMGLKSDIAAMVEEIIAQHGAIPATYMSRICKYHFTYKNYRQNLQRLKLKGVDYDNQRIGGVLMKVYYCK